MRNNTCKHWKTMGRIYCFSKNCLILIINAHLSLSLNIVNII